MEMEEGGCGEMEGVEVERARGWKWKNGAGGVDTGIVAGLDMSAGPAVDVALDVAPTRGASEVRVMVQLRRWGLQYIQAGRERVCDGVVE